VKDSVTTVEQRDRERSTARWLILGAGLAFIIAVIPWLGYWPDDLFIYLRFARHVAQSGQWAFNPGSPVAGATSPPWVILLSLAAWAGIPLGFAAKAIGIAMASGVVVMTYAVCRAYGLTRPLAIAASAVVASSHWLGLWSAAGMETPLAPFLLLSAVWAMKRWRPGSPVVGVFLGLAALSRPDAAPASLVLLSWATLRAEGRRRPALWLAAAFVVLPWLVFSKTVLGSWFPMTVSAKGAFTWRGGHIVASLVRTALVAASESLPLFLLAAAAYVSDREVRRTWNDWFFLLAAASTYPLGYAFNNAFGGVEASGRYLVPWFVLGSVASLLILRPWLRRPGRRWLVPGAIALAVCQSFALAIVHRPAVLRYERYSRDTLVPAGRWLRKHGKPGDVVAAGDIGVIGFTSGLHVLDLAGIVNPDAQRWSRLGTTFEELCARRPKFFINPAWRPGFDPAALDPFTKRVVFSHTHVRYRWTLHPGTFTVTLRVLAWPRAGTGGTGATTAPVAR